jgi:flagellar biosynthesis protein FlhA
VGEVVGELVPVGLLQRVLQNLLEESIPVRDMSRILEAIGEAAPRTKSAKILTEVARKAIARTITEKYKDFAGRVIAVSLDPQLEHHLLVSLRQDHDEVSLAVEPEITTELTKQFGRAWKAVLEKGYDKAVVLCDARLRTVVKSLVSRVAMRVPVVAYDEIASGTQVDAVETIKVAQAVSAPPAATSAV